MADLYFPSVLTVNRSNWTYIDNATRFTALSGISRTYSRTGDRWKATLEIAPGDSEHRANLHAFISAMQGGVNSVWVYDHSYTRRGSFPSTELLSNNTFANGTTGWTAIGGVSLSASGQRLRMTAGSSYITDVPGALQSGITVTQWAPYVVRSVTGNKKGFAQALFSPFVANGGGAGASNYIASTGYNLAAIVMDTTATGSVYAMVANDTDNFAAGDSLDCFWSSLSRCALVDNGPNLLLQSQTLGTSWTLVNATVGSNSLTAPDGTTTADSLIDDATSGVHSMYQTVAVSSAAADYTFSCYIRFGGRLFSALSLSGSTDSCTAYFLYNGGVGAIGATGSTGGEWTNLRTSIQNVGNGWFRCTLTARKTSSATSVSGLMYAAEADNDAEYSGAGTAAIYLWGASLAQSSVPVRYTETTTTATTGSAPSGSGVYLKGLPASTSGLLLPGDRVQIGDEYKMVTAPLDSNAAGLGYLMVSPAIRQAHADNAPVIINQPMCRMMLASNENGWDNALGPFSTASIDLVEDLRT